MTSEVLKPPRDVIVGHFGSFHTVAENPAMQCSFPLKQLPTELDSDAAAECVAYFPFDSSVSQSSCKAHAEAHGGF